MSRELNLPFKKWSVKFDRCIKCGTMETKHVARGYCRNCYDRNIEARHKDVNRKRNYGGSSALLTENYLRENHVNNGNSLADIAKAANCSRQYVHKQMVRYGIPERSKSSARTIALSQGKVIRENVSFEGSQQFVTLERISLNKEFFSTWSSKMAYVLGVIYTDGNLSPRGGTCPIDHFTISQKDPELLIKVLALMECNAKIFFRKEHTYNGIKAGALHWFRIAENGVYNELIKLGLSPNKSRKISFPDLPSAYLRHFIRGCWDGDGSVYLDKSSKKISASFVSGSLKFVEGMVSSLLDAGFPKRNIYIQKGKNPAYYFRITGRQVPLFYHFLYDDVPSSQYLESKFNLLRLSLGNNI